MAELVRSRGGSDRGVVLVVLLAMSASSGVRAHALERPRLYFGPGDVPALQQRAGREPYAAFYRRYKNILENKTDLPNPELDSVLMETQLGALVYTITREKRYAERAKIAYLRRIASWEREIPSYEYEKRKHRISLSVSRQLQNTCTDFDLLAPAGVFSEEEQTRVENTLAMVVDRLMERHDAFNPYDYYLERFRVDNWNTDRVMAVGMFALTFPHHPRSPVWLEHAVGEMKWQLDHALLPDGAWPEGTRYHGAVLRAMVPFAYALRRNSAIDLFDHPRFKAMFASLIPLQTPRITTTGNVALMPGVGDSNWESIWETVLAWGAPAFVRSDPALAGRLMWAWERAGSPFVVEFSPGNPIMGFLFIDAAIAPIAPADVQSDLRPGGYALLRSGFGTDRESYFHFNVGSPRGSWQHQHRDRGSFSLIAWNTPLAVDPGVHDYAVSLDKWFARSRAHNQVVFDDADNRDGARLTNHFFSDSVDYVEADLTPSTGGPYRRLVFFVKPHFYLIWDAIDHPQPAAYHLHVLTRDEAEPIITPPARARLERVTFPCPNDLELELGILSPPRASTDTHLDITADPYPVQFYAERDFVPRMVSASTPHWLRLRQDRVGRDFITVLYPKNSDAKPLELIRFQRDEQGLDGGRIQLGLGSLKATFLLGPQVDDEFSFEGTAVVVLRDEIESREEVFVVDGRRLKSSSGLDLAWEQPRTTMLGLRSPGEAAAALVRPIDWSRFDRSSSGSQHERRCRQLLLENLRHNLGWAQETLKTDPSKRAYVLESMNEHGVRPACSVLYSLATALKTGLYDEAKTGVAKTEARARARRLLRATTMSHRVNRAETEPDGWGDGWQSALWAALSGFGGWMLWDELEPNEHQALAAMVVHEADRFGDDYRVPYWNGEGGDTKAEENAWNSMILDLAVAMMPEHPHAARWKRKASELMISAYATEQDWRDNTEVLDGRRVKDWLGGYNALPGGVVVNHGFVHPDYMVAQTMNLWAYLTQSLAAKPVPQAADFNGALIYRTLMNHDWPSPPYEAPGGTIYVPGKPNVYYPKGVDWSTYDVSPYYLIDVWAHVLDWYPDAPSPPAVWMKLRTEKMLQMQRRHADGRMFAPGEYDTYPGVEQWVAWCLTDAFFALWLDGRDALASPAKASRNP